MLSVCLVCVCVSVRVCVCVVGRGLPLITAAYLFFLRRERNKIVEEIAAQRLADLEQEKESRRRELEQNLSQKNERLNLFCFFVWAARLFLLFGLPLITRLAHNHSPLCAGCVF